MRIDRGGSGSTKCPAMTSVATTSRTAGMMILRTSRTSGLYGSEPSSARREDRTHEGHDPRSAGPGAAPDATPLTFREGIVGQRPARGRGRLLQRLLDHRAAPRIGCPGAGALRGL